MSSKRRLRRKSCEGKVRHASAEAAAFEIRAIRARSPGTPRINAYRCDFCNGYHVGHAPGSGPRPF